MEPFKTWFDKLHLTRGIIATGLSLEQELDILRHIWLEIEDYISDHPQQPYEVFTTYLDAVQYGINRLRELSKSTLNLYSGDIFSLLGKYLSLRPLLKLSKKDKMPYLN